MIQSLLDIAGSPDRASFMAVVIAYVWCPQGVPRRIRAAKKRKKPSETGLGWFTTSRRKEAPPGFEPALADLQSPRIFVVSRLGACFLPSRLLHCGSPFLGRLLGFLFVLFFYVPHQVFEHREELVLILRSLILVGERNDPSLARGRTLFDVAVLDLNLNVIGWSVGLLLRLDLGHSLLGCVRLFF